VHHVLEKRLKRMKQKQQEWCMSVSKNTYFPNPTVQAMILLDETGNDLSIAIEMALMNVQKEDVEADRYWFAVLDALMVEEQVN
jgi:hypothetical protein